MSSSKLVDLEKFKEEKTQRELIKMFKEEFGGFPTKLLVSKNEHGLIANLKKIGYDLDEFSEELIYLHYGDDYEQPDPAS